MGQQHLSLMDTRFRVGGGQGGVTPDLHSPSTPTRPTMNLVPLDFRHKKAENRAWVIAGAE